MQDLSFLKYISLRSRQFAPQVSKNGRSCLQPATRWSPLGAAPVKCMCRNGLVLAAALVLSTACASHKPSSSGAQTQSSASSAKQAMDHSSRSGQQGGEQAQESAQPAQERSGRQPADETETGSQASSAQTHHQRAQKQTRASDQQGAAAQGDRQATTNRVTSEQVGGSVAAYEESIRVYSGSQTEEEHRRRLDRDLNRSLAEFDERLRREQAELDEEASRAAAQRAAQGGGGNIAVGRQVGLRPTTAPPPDAGSGGGDQPDLARGERIPSGEDDDVVARQLREAAQKEQDPELRKKLWEEYRAYKESSG